MAIQNFTQLTTWQEAHKLVLLVYKLTKIFPKDEIYSLTSQMRRCVVSVTSNIAEGFSRQSYKEKIQFYSIALGSLIELKNQLIIARDLAYIDNSKFGSAETLTTSVERLIRALIRSSKTHIPSSKF